MKTLCLSALALAALTLAGCKHEPDADEVGLAFQIDRMKGRDADAYNGVASRYAPGNIRQGDRGEVIPLQVTQDSVAAHPRSVRNIMTPQGVKGYDLHRFVDADNPRVFHRYSNIAVLEEDAFWRADGDDAALIEGKMSSASVGNLGKQSSFLKSESINQLGEQARNNAALSKRAEELMQKSDSLIALIKEKEDVHKRLLESYEKLVTKNRADTDDMEKIKAELNAAREQIAEASKKLGRQGRARQTQIEGQ
jgi:hypothetical protein